MNNKINLTYEGKNYELEFTRKSIMVMERSGFKIDEVSPTNLTSFQELFKGAFISKHRHVKDDIKQEIFDGMKNKTKLFSKLNEMYINNISSLFEETDEQEEGKDFIDWE